MRHTTKQELVADGQWASERAEREEFIPTYPQTNRERTFISPGARRPDLLAFFARMKRLAHA